MIITRKIEISVEEHDKELRESFQGQMHQWRDIVRSSANELLSYLYSIDRLKHPVDPTGFHTILQERLKESLPSGILKCLVQDVNKKYRETRNALLKGNVSLYTFRNNILIPFAAQSISQLHWSDNKKCFLFNLFGVPFRIILGRDKSNNRKIVEDIRCGGIRIFSSYLLIDDIKKKTFLFLNIDVSVNTTELDKDKYINAILSSEVPLLAGFEGCEKEIGTKDEFQHRLLQIQAGIKRARTNSRYFAEGKGRKRKTQSLGKLLLKEKDYINTRIHTYAKILIDYAIENKCGTINLIHYAYKEKTRKREPLLLRNWNYYGLKRSIEYKAKLYGINSNMVIINN
ncbi:MAG: hypothetical protein WC833_00870 [Bacteroidales bacterium]|jgi:IS605 OrfB family transposase